MSRRNDRSRTRSRLVLVALALLLIGSGAGIFLSGRVDPPAPRDDTASEADVTSASSASDESVEPDALATKTVSRRPAPRAKPEPKEEEPKAEEKKELSALELARLRANETAAIATARNIMSSQAQFQATAICDEDSDGVGEFGCFGALSGASPVRGTNRKLVPPVLSHPFQTVQSDGVVERSGYRYRIYLPALGGGWTTESPGGLVSRRVDPDRAETEWRLVAWPKAPGRSGRRSFFVDQNGDIWASAEETPPTTEPTDRSLPNADDPVVDRKKRAPDGRLWKWVR